MSIRSGVGEKPRSPCRETRCDRRVRSVVGSARSTAAIPSRTMSDIKATDAAEQTPWLIARSNWPTVKSIPYEVAVLPWGATEAHGLHLPYATDVYEIEAIAAESAKR